MIAVIPARAGSKGLPGKNIKPLNGKPLIYYSIKAALESKCFERVIVSTDSKKIAEISEKYGAEIPFLRPKELAQDNSLSIDVYLNLIEILNNKGENHECFTVLQPTSPLRTATDIINSLKIFNENEADSVISVKKAPHPPEWFKKIDNNGILEDFFNKSNLKNRQDYEQAYLPNGAIYILKYSLVKKYRNYYFKKTYPYIMPEKRSTDIDTEYDFKLAESTFDNF